MFLCSGQCRQKIINQNLSKFSQILCAYLSMVEHMILGGWFYGWQNS